MKKRGGDFYSYGFFLGFRGFGGKMRLNPYIRDVLATGCVSPSIFDVSKSFGGIRFGLKQLQSNA